MSQHILYPKDWDVVLVVGWDPALDTYYAQVRTVADPPEDSEKYIPLPANSAPPGGEYQTLINQ